MNKTLVMTQAFLKIFSRDRQSMFFSLVFPLLMMLAFSLVNGDDIDPVNIGVADDANSDLSQAFIDSLDRHPLFNVTTDREEMLRVQVVTGDLSLAVLLPENFRGTPSNVELRVLIDASQTAQMNTVMPLLEQALVEVERELRELNPLFELSIEDIEARSQNYLDFVVPGLLALALMQIAMGGSGFNLVEFRRKGILKRMFVTPIEPRDFISGMVISRLVIVLVQLSILLGIAVYLLDITFVGNLFNLYVFIILGTTIFLSLGFMLGSLAKTQQSIMAMNMMLTWPQMLLTGIFYPIEAMPEIIQPLASLLPLSFIVNGLRGVAIDGATLLSLLPDLIGAAVWIMIGMILAVRVFNWKEVAV